MREDVTALFRGRDDAVALMVPDDGVAISFGELRERTASLADSFRTLGIAPGSIVATVVPDGPSMVQLFVALASLGAAVAPLNPRYTVREFAFYLDDLCPDLLVVPTDREHGARAAAPAGVQVAEVDTGDRVAVTPGSHSYLPATRPADRIEETREVALLLHTSGTTSRPKQVPLTHSNLVASARTIARHYELGPDDVSYCAMPLFHVHGLVASVLAPLAGGGASVIPRRPSSRRIWRDAVVCGVTWYSASPALHDMFLSHLGDRPDVPRFRFVRSCSAAMPAALARELESRLHAPLLQAYGMTEASHQISSNPLPPGTRVPESVGVPTGTNVRVVGDGEVFDEGRVGEVEIRGAGVAAGYVKNPEATEAAFADGWFKTGDLGVFVDGYLHLRGRINEVINRGGEKVSPFEVEEVLRSHPAVAEAAAFPRANDRYGEVVEAAVTLGRPATSSELIEHCRGQLAHFKVPAAIHLVEEIPRTATGKVQRRLLSSRFTEES